MTRFTRRSILRAGAATSGVALLGTMPTRLLAQEPEKPSEIIVRAWGGEWVESLKRGVSDPFTEMTGI